MCDLHLPKDEGALQYSAYKYALDEITKRGGDLAVFAGDFTSDGDGEVYTRAIKSLKSLNMPILYIPGNSDLRNVSDRDKNHADSSEPRTEINGIGIYAINDADRSISPQTLELLEGAHPGDVVFMHHPIFGLSEPSRLKMTAWREAHPEVYLFFAHIHKAYQRGRDFSLPTLDPDKSIGESPSITLFDTDTGIIEQIYYPCPVPKDVYSYFGITSYRAEEHISFATEHSLPCLELRPSALNIDRDELVKLIANWRSKGGERLSIHLPEITYLDGEVKTATTLTALIELANLLGADRLTQHAPKVSVKLAREDKGCLCKMAKALADALDLIEDTVTIGIENMHMTDGEAPDDGRRYGYLPSECLEFMNILSEYTKHNVGINLDIGHARNNAPFSENYQISGWFSAVGKHCVGYHVHQVSVDENFKRHNHTAITDVYGHLISYASLFKCWEENRINKAPLIFEMDGKDAYKITLDTFQKHKS